MSKSKSAVVCGAGVIGCCVAWFLARRGVDVTVVDRSDIAGAASGKSGGFLARDWLDGSALEPLAHMSFDMHQELADTLDGSAYGYRPMSAYSVVVPAGNRGLRSGSGQSLEWLSDSCFVRGKLGDSATTAQLTPELFTRRMMEAATECGARFVQGTVQSIEVVQSSRQVRGVRVDGEVLEADHIVVALGPWTAEAKAWMNLPEIDAVKGDSIVLRPHKKLPAHALFVDMEAEDGDWYSPEVFPRPDGSVYLCGASDDEQLPDDPRVVRPSSHGTARLVALARLLSRDLFGAPMVSKAACYRTVCADGPPVIGEAPGMNGLWIASGHGAWGMLNAPASGMMLADMITLGHSSKIDPGVFAVDRGVTEELTAASGVGR